MSSEDVIELGSSDEEVEPAPKRSKPMPNAMVCIPRNLHDVTIKPAKSSKPTKPTPSGLPKGLIGKPITVHKVTGGKSQVVMNKSKVNGKPVQPLRPKIAFNPYSDRMKPVPISTKPSNSNISVVKPSDVKPVVRKVNLPFMKAPIKIQNPKALALPPSITVKKTASNRPIVMLNVKGEQPVNKNLVNDVMTVELDDEEVQTRNSSPQWYLRPEEQTEGSAPEDENNKEPEASNLIEITIEDSPVKPVHNKRTHEVGAELAITIDDSPVKAPAEKEKDESGSENEHDASSNTVPQSKKKLEYLKKAEDTRTLEIEIEPIVIKESSFSDISDKKDPIVIKESSFSDISDKKDNVTDTSSAVKDDSENTEKAATLVKENKIEVQLSEPSEFHPVYQSFINLCFQLENSEDMTKIVDKKIKGYYRQVPKEYTESEEFTDLVSGKMLSMKTNPEKMYLYIKDVVDELNLQRKLAKSRPVEEVKNEEVEPIEESVYDSKRRRQIRKLEKTIKKLHRAIQKLEEQEVDFDDEDDSVYILTERYKERMVRVYAKFCQLSNTKMPSEPRIQIDARPGRPSGPVKRLEKWINKKVPIGTPLPFPDFHDVLRCVRQANEEDKLNLNEADIMEEARDLFTRCGRKLQRRRQENEWRLAASRIALDIDPAEKNEDLKRKLSENKKIASEKETEIFNKFADRQKQLKLEAEEIGDKEAEESPVESEEEEANEETGSLENTEKRKERLKRLLHEKSKKASEEKENHPSNDDVQNNDGNTVPETTEVKEENAEKAVTQDEQPQEETNKEDGSKENAETSKNDENATEIVTETVTETLTLSDDSNELESDIDELHLLQKLHSPHPGSSTADSSDSDCRIAISDTSDYEDDKKDRSEMSDNADVISIENSSYSEDENNTVVNTQVSNTDSVQFINEDVISEGTKIALPAAENAIEVEVGNKVVANTTEHTNNDENNGAVENILLASSGEDSQDGATEAACVNLRDDLISIDETVIGNFGNESEAQLQNKPSATAGDIHSETTLIEVNKEALPSKNGNAVKETNGSNEPKEFVEDSVDIISSDEKSNESVERMDVDQDDNEMAPTGKVTLGDNIPSTSTSEES